MNINIHKSSPKKKGCILLPFFEDEVDHQLIATHAGESSELDFNGGFKQKLTLYPVARNKVLLLGLGKRNKSNQAADAFRNLAFKKHKRFGDRLIVLMDHLPEDLLIEAGIGLQMAQYKIGAYKTDQDKASGFFAAKYPVHVVHTSKDATSLFEEGVAIGETRNQMMRLVDMPADRKTPAYLGKYAQQSGKKHGFKVKIHNKSALKKLGCEAILAVGRGSEQPPVMIEMEYKPKGLKSKKPKLGLAGKGITFDTGGLSIKGSNNMHYMKSDMGGAAAVIGAMELASKLKLNIHVVGIVCASENSVDALSIRPGDIIGSYSGKSIEIIDTDAEGRLVLADGLAYLKKKHQPEIMVDLATLTGSCVRTFGYACGGLFSNDDDLANRLMEAGQKVRERVWRLPIWDDYSGDIHSDVADVRNFSGKPINGAIAAAKFLEVFTNEHPSWAHLDIAGVAFGSSEYTKMKAATGYGPRLLLNFMRSIS